MSDKSFVEACERRVASVIIVSASAAYLELANVWGESVSGERRQK
jgi:hypothetical protein